MFVVLVAAGIAACNPARYERQGDERVLVKPRNATEAQVFNIARRRCAERSRWPVFETYDVQRDVAVFRCEERKPLRIF